MSNLNNFLNHRKTCPFCSSDLNFVFQSRGKDLLRFEKNGLKVTKLITEWKLSSKSSSYTIELNIDCDTNEFFVNFLNKNNEPQDVVSYSTIKNYMEYRKNQDKKFYAAPTNTSRFQLYKECLVCKRYTYSSTDLIFNYKSSFVEPFYVGSESLVLVKEDGNEYKAYTVYNMTSDNEMIIYCNKVQKKDLQYISVNVSVIGYDKQELPIKMPSFDYDLSAPQELLNKLEMLVLFS